VKPGPNGTPENGIYCGDCLPLLRDLPDGYIDAVVTDPPYQVSLNADLCPWDIWPDPAIWQELYRVTKSGGFLAFTIAPRVAHERIPDVLAAGWQVLEVGFWIWGNGRPVHVRRLKRSYDLVYFLSKDTRLMELDDAKCHYPSGTISGNKAGQAKRHSLTPGRHFRSGSKRFQDYQYSGQGNHPANVACLVGSDALAPSRYELIFAVKRINRAGKTEERHPTGKPIDLVGQIIKIVSVTGDIILDPFMGRASTAVAAVLTGRQYLGFEAMTEEVRLGRVRVRETQPPLMIPA